MLNQIWKLNNFFLVRYMELVIHLEQRTHDEIFKI